MAPGPVPVRATPVGEFEPLLTKEIVPDAAPATVGANFAVRVLDCPLASVRGNVGPLMLNPGPLTLAWETVKLALPVLLSVIVCVPVLPVLTFPKGTVLGLILSWPFPGVAAVLEETTPAHPVTETHESRAKRSAKPRPRRKLRSQTVPAAWRPVKPWPKRPISRFPLCSYELGSEEPSPGTRGHDTDQGDKCGTGPNAGHEPMR